jgi:hypothetical protein
MLTLDEAIETHKERCFDHRDTFRLSKFVPVARLGELGIELKEGSTLDDSTTIPWTKENIMERLESDVKFGYEKARDGKGISSSLMFSCVAMWNRILQEGLEGFDDYGSYGEPLFRATAEKYGWEL